MPTAGLSADLHSVERSVRIKGFPEAQTRVGFVHQGKVFALLDIFEIQVSYPPDVVTTDLYRIVLGHSADDLILLGLVLDD